MDGTEEWRDKLGGLTNIQHSTDDRALLRGQADRLGVVRQRIQQNDVPQLGEDTPSDQQQDGNMSELPQIEELLLRLHGLIPIFQQNRADEVDDERQQREQAVRPRQSERRNRRPSREVIHDASKPRPGRRQPDGQTPLPREPLRHDRRGRQIQEPHPVPEAAALREAEMPDLGREGGGQERERDERGADEEGDFGAEGVVGPADEGRDHEGLRDGEAADDGAGELRGVWEGGVGEVAGEEDAPGLRVVGLVGML